MENLASAREIILVFNNGDISVANGQCVNSDLRYMHRIRKRVRIQTTGRQYFQFVNSKASGHLLQVQRTVFLELEIGDEEWFLCELPRVIQTRTP